MSQDNRTQEGLQTLGWLESQAAQAEAARTPFPSSLNRGALLTKEQNAALFAQRPATLEEQADQAEANRIRDARARPTPPPPQEGNPMPNDKILKHFDANEADPVEVQKIKRPYHGLAHHLFLTVASGPERSTALRKLLESMDAAIRAKLHPGG